MRYIKTTPNKWIYHYTVTTPAFVQYMRLPFGFEPSTEYEAVHSGGNMYTLLRQEGERTRSYIANTTGDSYSMYQPYKVKRTKTPNPEYAVWLAKKESLNK